MTNIDDNTVKILQISGTLLNTVITIVGFYIVHKLSIRRQRRDEIFKIVVKIIDEVNDIGQAAYDAWSVSCLGNANAQEKSFEVIRRIHRLSTTLKKLEKEKIFKIGDNRLIIEFRKTITEGIDSETRSASLENAAKSSKASMKFERELLIKLISQK